MKKSVLLLLMCGVLVGTCFARVVRVDVKTRTDVLGGKPFGSVGAYEKITGRVYFAVDPKNPHNRQIVDLDKAQRNAQGAVEFSADFYILRPKDAAKNETLLLEVPNRGGKGMLRIFNGAKGSPDPTTAEEFGDGFLMRQGYTVAWVGWQFDVAEDDATAMHLQAPIARDGEKPITGFVRADWCPAERKDVMPLGHYIGGRIGGEGYPVSDPTSEKNSLTVRDCPTCERTAIAREQWGFPDDKHVALNSGFEPGKIYEVVYVAKDPAVVGVGLAAVRDFVSYLKYDERAVAPVKRAYAIGISQTGRFLRHYLWQDFNGDEKNRMVLDGVISHVAGAGRGSFNHRFAQPSRDAQPTSSVFFPTDLFPFTDVPATDGETDSTAGLLDASNAAKHTPKLFLTNTSYEYWSRASSLIHTTPDGKQDVEPGPNVRIYLYTGLQHFSGPFPPAYGNGDLAGQQLQNPLPVQWLWRAAIVNMDRWVRARVEPPPSAYPKLADRTLVPLRWLVFPQLQDVSVPKTTVGAYRLDFGSDWKRGIVTKEPPAVGKAFPTLVPQVDGDGNDVSGVRLPEVDVPVATYTGWNLRSPKIGMPPEKASFIGSYIPFAKSAADREQTHDPRSSLAERYKGKADYMARYRRSAERLIEQRFLLSEDLNAVLARGEKEWEAVAGAASAAAPAKP